MSIFSKNQTKKVVVNAACFMPDSSISSLDIIVALNNGTILRVKNR